MTTNTQDFSKLTTKELVGIYNGLGPDIPLRAWKGKKTVLMERVKVLCKQALSETEADDKPSETTEEPVAEDVVPKVTGNSPVRTIRAASIAHLCFVDYYEDKEKALGPDNRVDLEVQGDSTLVRSVGLAYDEIIRRVKAEFPTCETSVACLRWYCVKMRVNEKGYENFPLPQRRPRVRPTKRS